MGPVVWDCQSDRFAVSARISYPLVGKPSSPFYANTSSNAFETFARCNLAESMTSVAGAGLTQLFRRSSCPWDEVRCVSGEFGSARRMNSRDSFGGGFRHHADLLREGDEAGVVLVGAQERIIKQLSHTRVVRGPGVLQPLEHLLRLLAQGVDLSDLAAAVVRVFVDQFF